MYSINKASWCLLNKVVCLIVRLSYNLNQVSLLQLQKNISGHSSGDFRLLIYAFSFLGLLVSYCCCYYSNGGRYWLAHHPCHHHLRNPLCFRLPMSIACYYRRFLSCHLHLDLPWVEGSYFGIHHCYFQFHHHSPFWVCCVANSA